MVPSAKDGAISPQATRKIMTGPKTPDIKSGSQPVKPKPARTRSKSVKPKPSGAGSQSIKPKPAKAGSQPVTPKPARTGSRSAKHKPKRAPLTRSEVMARIKSKNTKPELLVRRALWGKGYRYRLHDKKLPGRPDLTIKRLKTAIFVHGCFWHAHDDCPNFRHPKSRLDYWSPKLAKNKSRDEESRKKLESDGWRVVTIWECQLEKPDWLANLLSLLEGGPK